jgi:hypothetical protein
MKISLECNHCGLCMLCHCHPSFGIVCFVWLFTIGRLLLSWLPNRSSSLSCSGDIVILRARSFRCHLMMAIRLNGSTFGWNLHECSVLAFTGFTVTFPRFSAKRGVNQLLVGEFAFSRSSLQDGCIGSLCSHFYFNVVRFICCWLALDPLTYTVVGMEPTSRDRILWGL